MKDLIIFDLSQTLVKMRPAKLLVNKDQLELLAKKYNLAIVTGAKKTEAFNILKKLQIINLFKLVITKEDTPYKKPDPRIFSLIKKTIVFDKALYVGDSMKDYYFARNSNIPFYYIGKQRLGKFQDKDINKLLKYIQGDCYAN